MHCPACKQATTVIMSEWTLFLNLSLKRCTTTTLCQLMVHRVPVPEDTLFLKTYLTTSFHVRRILDALMKCKRAVRFVVFFSLAFFPFRPSRVPCSAVEWSISPLATLSKYTVWCAHRFRARLVGVRNLSVFISCQCSGHVCYLYIIKFSYRKDTKIQYFVVFLSATVGVKYSFSRVNVYRRV